MSQSPPRQVTPTAAQPAAPAPRPAGVVAAAPVAGRQTMQAKARAASGGDGDEDDELYDDEPSPMMLFLRTTPSWVASGVFHMILFIILALITKNLPEDPAGVMVASPPEEEEKDTLDDLEDELEEQQELDVPDVNEEWQPPTELTEEVRPDLIDDNEAAEAVVTEVDVGLPLAVKIGLTEKMGTPLGKGIEGRGDPAARAAALAAGGGTPGSENAVTLALEWLAKHQMADGGWNYDHRQGGACQGQCKDHGALGEARVGATAMAVLPFLGYGMTHKKGKYKNVVHNGLVYLGKQMKNNGSMWEDGGRMYSHGLAAITLCEAYAMTRDPLLHDAAQNSLNFISEAQDPIGGGWRYTPKEKGDTSVVGWQIMALKSGHMAYLLVNPNTIKGAEKFLDSVQEESGSYYGYTAPGRGQATTAIGLLCRMYLGWKHDNGALQRGVEFLSQTGPSDGNMYYNYYATQVMRHYDGPLWKKWNEHMREYLVRTQDQQGHQRGSWFLRGGDHGSSRGGRLYTTAMAAMTLEVYYRHMPLYKGNAAEDNFEE